MREQATLQMVMRWLEILFPKPAKRTQESVFGIDACNEDTSTVWRTWLR